MKTESDGLRRALQITAFTGFSGVALGAFGAHGLRHLLEQNGTAAIWEKAVFYQLVHAVGMLALLAFRPFPRGPWTCWLAGIAVFSGSLYVLAWTGIRWLGAITPLGGVSLLAGWLWLAWAAARPGNSPES
ncbi:MAG: DUF423 domain-containing protein [Verrucomicrobiota bacterium]